MKNKNYNLPNYGNFVHDIFYINQEVDNVNGCVQKCYLM